MRSDGRDVAACGPAGAQVGEEPRERLLAGAEKDRVGVRGGFVGQRRHVQAAERDERAAGAIVVREPVGAPRVGDVDLDDDEIGTVVEIERRDMLVLDDRLVVRSEIGGERGQTERRKERVLDRPPVRAGRFGQRRQDELDAQRSPLMLVNTSHRSITF